MCVCAEKCELSSECEAGEPFATKRHDRLSQDLLHYVHQLMASKGYPERR